jgi:hypothetical protein
LILFSRVITAPTISQRLGSPVRGRCPQSVVPTGTAERPR